MSAVPTSPVARLERDGPVAVIIVDSPPVNALGQLVRQALLDMTRWADAQENIQAIVIRCDGRTFFAGADIREFAQAPKAPGLPEVVNAIEDSATPVIAAIHGTALGGGLEVALGCHYRIALPSAKLGVPEVKLGILPGAGGTQRLPRVVPVDAALEMMTSGRHVPAPEAAQLGLVDELVEGDLAEAALAVAHRIATSPSKPTRSRDRDAMLAAAPGDTGLFDRFLDANARKFRGLDAPKAIVAAAQAAIDLPFRAGLERERELFEGLASGPQAPALQHVFFAEREAAKVPGLDPKTPLRDIASVGIIGAGTMGSGIAINFLLAGIPVIMVETAPAALDRGAKLIADTIDRNVAAGRTQAELGAKAKSLLTQTLDFDALAVADLVIEAAFEEMGVKRDIFTRLDSVAKPGAILATNTSYLNVDEIASVTKRPQDVLGLHFFSPANIMKLLEVVRAEETADDVLATALALAKRIGKVAVVAGVAFGFIGNRMLHIRRLSAEALVMAGVSPYRIDRVLEDFGMPMGAFRMYDLAGLDIGWSAETSAGETIQDRLCELGRRGQKTGAGYYDYDANRRAVPSPIVEQLVADYVAEKSGTPLDLTDDQVLERLLYPMIDEGYRILDEGKAYRASDIDTVWLNGYGWPAWTGGPMFHAARVGPARLVQGLQEMGHTEIAAGLIEAARERGDA